jgi:acyl dehydratase
MPELLYLEDLPEGRRFESAERDLDAAAITAFAAEFDPQPFHTDPDAAQATFFQGLAASGWHTAALTMRLLVESLPIAGGLIGAGAEIAWPRPTRPGDRLRVVSTVRKATPSRSRPDRGSIELLSETLNQRDELVQRLVSRMIVPRRPAPEG